MSADTLIAALDGVVEKGAGRWHAKCPAHNDKRPSLTITEKDDGRVLMKCWAGCSAFEICAAVGLDISELFPPRTSINRKPEKQSSPYSAMDILRASAFEATVASVIIYDLLNGKGITPASKDRLLTAAGRLQAAESLASGR